MPPMFVTPDVSKLETSSEASAVQSENMLAISVALEVLKFERLIETRFEHP